MMIHPILHQKTVRCFLALLITGILLAFSLPAYAIDEAIGPGTIKSIPGTKYDMDHDYRQEAGNSYDFVGIVDIVHEEGIVISDSYFKKAARAKISGARIGANVGLVLNGDREIVLCEPYKKSSR